MFCLRKEEVVMAQGKHLLTQFSIRRPRLVFFLVLLAVAIAGGQFPKVQFDNDPENMLLPNEPVRVFHRQVKERYALYDAVVVGVVNEDHPDGIFNRKSLGRIHDLSGQLARLHRTEQGFPAVVTPARPGQPEQRFELDLRPEGWWPRLLNLAFRHDPNRLFDQQGQSAIIAREIIAPSVVDNIRQAEQGALAIEYLMETPPLSQAEARTIRDHALGNPLYAGTLFSEDQKAVALYIPIVEKHYSYNVAALVRALTADWPAEDQIYITGLPVAEDTFGVEMLVQMATSAPLAGLAIFVLMLLFFRKLTLIIAPMLVAGASIVLTMGLLIGLGYDVHIMSSMIAIFLMPIAVADAIHILSEFFDTYAQFGDKAATLRHVVGHLFMPMLYTTLTTVAGFSSLATTPIPPVQVFGLHVAFGVAMAWVLTMTLVPAYIMLFVPAKTLAGLTVPKAGEKHPGRLNRFVEGVGSFSFRHAKLILGVTMMVIVVAVYGITRIEVNDNPVNWFTPDHEIRVADDVLNHHFAGTYTAYLVLRGDGATETSLEDWIGYLEAQAEQVWQDPQRLLAFKDLLASAKAGQTHADPFFEVLHVQAAKQDQMFLSDWDDLADTILYLDPQGLSLSILETAIAGRQGAEGLIARLAGEPATAGAALQDQALAMVDLLRPLAYTDFIARVQLEREAPLFKRPAMLRYLEGLQEHLHRSGRVGKTNSAADALKKAAFELQRDVTMADATAEEQAHTAQANLAFYAVPDSVEAVGQVFTQLEGMKKKDSLFHMVTRDYQEANIWFQLTSGDNQDMEQVVRQVDEYLENHAAPFQLEHRWAGLTYINVHWQDKMVRGMLLALISSFAVVLLMMMTLFRSWLFGLMAMIPLTATITLSYGLIGLVGKEYDMPVAVLSALSLGLSVDFAIHFLQRARELQRQYGSWQLAIPHMFKEPAMAISRNAITISVGFTPLLFAPLVPYKTVGFFLATIMAVSWLATLFILAALVTQLRRFLFPKPLPVKEVKHEKILV